MSETTPTGRVPDATAGINAGQIGGHAKFTAQMVTLVTEETKALVLALAQQRRVGYGEIVREALDRTLIRIAEREADLGDRLIPWFPWEGDAAGDLTAQLTIMGTPAQDEMAKAIAAARKVNNRRERTRRKRAGEEWTTDTPVSVTRADTIRRALDLVLPLMVAEQAERNARSRAEQIERAALAARLPAELTIPEGNGGE
jgi:hypothetical protein